MFGGKALFFSELSWPLLKGHYDRERRQIFSFSGSFVKLQDYMTHEQLSSSKSASGVLQVMASWSKGPGFNIGIGSIMSAEWFYMHPIHHRVVLEDLGGVEACPLSKSPEPTSIYKKGRGRQNRNITEFVHIGVILLITMQTSHISSSSCFYRGK